MRYGQRYPGGVIDLRRGPGESITGLDQLGAGLAQLIGAMKFDPNQQLLDYYIQNPQIAQGLAEAYREDLRQLEGMAEVDPETGKRRVPVDPAVGDATAPHPVVGAEGRESSQLLQTLSRRHPGTFAEQVDVARRQEPGLAERMVRGEVGELETLESEREARVAKARAEIPEANNLERLSTLLGEAGFPEYQAALMLGGAQLDAAQQDLQMRFVQDAATLYPNLPPDERRLIALGSVSPAFTQGELQQRGFAHAERMADIAWERALFMENIRQMQTREERAAAQFKMRMDLSKEIDRTVGQIRTAMDGDRRERELVPSYVARLQALGNIQFEMFPTDQVLTSQTVRGLFGGVKGVEFGLEDLETARADEIVFNAELIREGRQTKEELMRQVQIGNIPENYAEAVLAIVENPLKSDIEAMEAGQALAKTGRRTEIQQRREEIDRELEADRGELSRTDIIRLVDERRILWWAQWLTSDTNVPQMRGPGGR